MPVRAAQPRDAAAIGAIHVLAWQQAYRGLLPDELLRNLSLERRTAYWRGNLDKNSSTVLVNELAERVAGFISFGPCRDTDAQPATAEIYALYLDPAEWSRGHGVALMHAALEQLRDHNFEDVWLWVLAGNRRAMRFYERAGFAPDGTNKVERLASGTEISELRYRRAL